MRNRINYQQSLGAWFPYRERPAYYEQLIKRAEIWRNDPDVISIWTQSGRDVQRFVETCALLVAICREVCLDMAQRCPKGKSFHHFALCSLAKRLKL